MESYINLDLGRKCDDQDSLPEIMSIDESQGKLALEMKIVFYSNKYTGYWNARLVGGSTPREGRVEVYINNQWGTVCDDHWSTTAAQVVCQQLGYSSSTSAHGGAYFGQGSGRILLDDVSCTGSETSLATCSHLGVGSHNCGHSEDVGVVCSPGEIWVRNSFADREHTNFMK